MFWRKRKQHPLPKFPANVTQTFKLLCGDADEQELQSLRQAVSDNFNDIVAKSADNDNLDLRAANRITELCFYLLDVYGDFSKENQRLIVGGVRYFAIADDPFDDETFANGFYDDMRVLNFVLEEIGIGDRYFILE